MPKYKILNSAGTKGSPFRLFNSAGITAAIGLASLPAFLTLAPMISPKGVFADEPTANSNASGAMALSVGRALAITAQNVNVTATPTIGNTFVTATSTVNVKNTGSSGGYHLIMSSENGGSLRDGSHSVNTFSEYSKTGAAMKSAGNSSWGWTLNPVNGTNSTPAINNSGDTQAVYNPIPTSTTAWNKTGDQSTSTYAYLKNTDDYTNITSGDDIVVGYGFAIGPDIPAGTYTDTITYTAIPNKDNRTIFDLSTMQDLSAYPDACANTPTPAVRTGDTPDTAVTTTTNSLTGYSVGQTNINKIPTVTLKDNRPMTNSDRTDLNDDKTKSYEVRKLADGNCWMTESLAIDGQDIEPTMSNVTAEILATAAVLEGDGIASGFEEAGKFKLPARVALGDARTNSTIPYVSGGGVDGQEGDTGMGGINGTYLYNWYAATAGTGTASLTNKQDASGDICPKGWQLPNASGNMSWDKLLREGQSVYEVSTLSGEYSMDKVNWGSYDSIKIATANPLSLQLTGNFGNDGLTNIDLGYYWTRTASSNTSNAYNMNFRNTNISPQSINGKGVGRGVRCVAQGTEAKTPANTTYMQDIDSCPSSLPLEQKFTVKDKRDNKEYTVARLADGNCWMTSSLAIENKTLTPELSNVTTNFDLPEAIASSATQDSHDTAYVANDGGNDTYLYNWFAATAAASDVSSIGAGENAPQDICPKGWQLPNGNGDKSWNRLLRVGEGVYEIATSGGSYSTTKAPWGKFTNGIDAAKNNPLGLQVTGRFFHKILEGEAEYGRYWARTAVNNSMAYSLGYLVNNISPLGSNFKEEGRAVRCVLK